MNGNSVEVQSINPFREFINNRYEEAHKLSSLDNYLEHCFPGFIISEFNEDSIMLTDYDTMNAKVVLGAEYIIDRIEYYPLQNDDSDNYERHTDGK